MKPKQPSLQSFDAIEESRKKQLAQLAALLEKRLSQGLPIKLVFICTHNSRRSQMAQLWAQEAAEHYKLQGVECFSGGTEATAFYPAAVKALNSVGFQIEALDAGENPNYRARWSEASELRMFSKTFDHSENPNRDFIAVMVCSDADENCPFVPGAEARFSLPYEDPKAYDGTEEEAQQYEARSTQIAAEMHYTMQLAKTIVNA